VVFLNPDLAGAGVHLRTPAGGLAWAYPATGGSFYLILDPQVLPDCNPWQCRPSMRMMEMISLEELVEIKELLREISKK
jgi:hypothetical protein